MPEDLVWAIPWDFSRSRENIVIADARGMNLYEDIGWTWLGSFNIGHLEHLRRAKIAKNNRLHQTHLRLNYSNIPTLSYGTRVGGN
jgi:hypothetical protein